MVPTRDEVFKYINTVETFLIQTTTVGFEDVPDADVKHLTVLQEKFMRTYSARSLLCVSED